MGPWRIPAMRLSIAALLIACLLCALAPGCSAVDPGACADSCHARWPGESRELLDCVAACSNEVE